MKDAITVIDPQTAQQWEIPRRKVTSIFADVSERWVVNVLADEVTCRELVPVPFLEPIPVAAGYVISLCAIFMRHAAPDWAPLQLGPASRNCALRIACRDTRTGDQAVWVDHRYSDSILVTALAKLGFPEVRADLRVTMQPDNDCPDHVEFKTADNTLALRLNKTNDPAPALAFANAEDFERYFTAGIRSYGPAAEANTATIVDLQKRSDNHFEAMPYTGELVTGFGEFAVDGVYRTVNGLYEWRYEGDLHY